MSTNTAPRSAGEILKLLSQILSQILNAAGNAGARLFDTLWSHVKAAWNAASAFPSAHPGYTAAFVILVLGVLLAQPVAKGIVTEILGFKSPGIQAGSIAAKVQSALYGGNVPAGSIFYFLQSFGAL